MPRCSRSRACTRSLLQASLRLRYPTHVDGLLATLGLAARSWACHRQAGRARGTFRGVLSHDYEHSGQAPDVVSQDWNARRNRRGRVVALRREVADVRVEDIARRGTLAERSQVVSRLFRNTLDPQFRHIVAGVIVTSIVMLQASTALESTSPVVLQDGSELVPEEHPANSSEFVCSGSEEDERQWG